MSKTSASKGWAKEDKMHMLHGAVPLDEFKKKGSKHIIDSGSRIRLRDSDGKEYIDALAGIVEAVLVGHSRIELAEAAYKQMTKLSFIPSFGGWTSTSAIDYAHTLADFVPKGLGRFFFANSGAEANETAYKLALYYWASKGYKSKNKIISRNLAYHGLNMVAMWATGIPFAHNNFGEPPPGIIHIPECYCYRCPFGKDYPDCSIECADALETAIKDEGKDNVAAFVAEPVYGVSGGIVPPPEYFPKIREICDKYEVLLILDEVITGFGRTGKNFACLHWGVLPDMICMSKGMTSSALPMSGVAMTEDIFKGMGAGPFFHLHTCGAHPVSCAVAKKNLEIIVEEKLVENAATQGDYLLDKLKKLQEEYPIIGQVQGLGLLLGIEIVRDKETKEMFPPETVEKLVERIFDQGVIVRTNFSSRIGISPSLIVKKEDVDEIVHAIETAVKKFKP